MHARAAGIASLTLIVGTTWVANLSAHSLLDTPDPRDQQDGYKDGTACGAMRASSQPVTRYVPGQELNVEWLETIDHNGCFLIELSAQGDQDFQILGRKSHSNPPPPASPSPGDPRPWNLQVTLPNTSCDACTLRLRQIMLTENLAEDACPPADVQQGSIYTTCANITLGSGGAGGSSGAAGGAAAGGAAAGGAAAGGAAAGGAAASGAAGAASANEESSCRISATRRPTTSLLASLFALVALCYRRATRANF